MAGEKDSQLQDNELELVSTDELATELLRRTDTGLIILVPRGEEVETIWRIGEPHAMVRSWLDEEEGGT